MSLEKFSSYSNLVNWHYLYNENVRKLDRDLLKLTAIMDLNTSEFSDGDIVVWDAVEERWIPGQIESPTTTT